MASGTFYPAASADDGYTLGTNFYYPSYDFLNFGNQGNFPTNAAYIRFATVAIPNGVTITSAFVRFTAYATNSTDPVNVNCHFEDVDDATQVTSAADYQSRSLTAAIAWNSVAAWTDGTTYDTPSLITILQAIVDRVGWAENNDLLFSIENNGTVYLDYRQASAIDYLSGAEKAELHVEWADPPGSDTEIQLEPLEGAFALSGGVGFVPSVAISPFVMIGTLSGDVTLIDPRQIVAANPFMMTGMLSGDVTLIDPIQIVAANPFVMTGTLSGAARLIQRSSFNGTLTLANSLKVGDTLSLVNSLNVQVSSTIEITLDLLQQLSGTLAIKNDLNERAKFQSTLDIINHILDAASGISQGEYYFLRSHGL